MDKQQQAQQQLEEALNERFPKSVHFEYVPITDEQVRELCEVKKTIVNMGFYGTAITDKALEYLATLPKLKYLFIEGAAITGEGFKHFATHPQLNCLWVVDSKVNDETLQLSAYSPR